MMRYIFRTYRFKTTSIAVVILCATYIGLAQAQMSEDELQRVVKACAAQTAKHIFGIQGLEIDESKSDSNNELLIHGHYFNQHMSGGIGEERFKFTIRASKQANGQFSLKVLNCE